MAAYSVDLSRRCDRCGGAAMVEVFNTYNASQGRFCRPCGKRRVRQLNENVHATMPKHDDGGGA